ncbi:cilia and flagella associated protein [Aureococcus anophagefferens]|uniref:Cilia and flagella associated protein n=1 Tax=Aureococcus anophagefferens TaxID=44056 RepID=A0ABR1G4J4_AURAN
MHTRRATPDDGPAISALITNCGGTPKYRKRFGTFNVANLLESGYLALVVGDRDLASSEGHQMLGFLVFSDGPRGAPHAAEPWLAALSAARFEPGKGPTIGDAVWLEFCVAESGSAGRAVVEAATTAALHALPAVDHVVLALGGKEDVPAECAGLFGRLEPVPRGDGEPDPALESLYKSTLAYCGREALVPTLLIRAACVEDSDDLLPIFEQQSEVLSANFGDFFLAEMIEAQDDMNRAVVATVDGRAVGLLAASTDIDVAMLQKCFQLEPYGNLVANAGPEAPAAEAPPPDADGGVADAAAAPAAAPAPAAPAASALAEAPASPRPTMKASAPFLKDFVAVPSRLGSTFSHTLFLLHRASLVAAEQLRVRRFPASIPRRGGAVGARGDDAVTADGEPAPTPDQIVAGLGADFSVPLEEGPNAAAFVAVVGGAVVAVASVSRKAASTNVLNWLKANYHIEDFEVMRLYDKTVLYHESALGDRMPPLVLKELVPVRARWRPTPEPGGALLLEHRPKGDDEPPRRGGRAGDDDTATELLFEPGLHLSHVTLFEALGLGQRLRVVHARVVDLDRANKAVVLPDGAIVLYDVLVLTNGLQESSAKRLARARAGLRGGLALLGDDGVHGDEFGDGEVMRLRRLAHDAETGELEKAVFAPPPPRSPPARRRRRPGTTRSAAPQQDMTVDAECGILLGADAGRDITSDLFLAVNEAGLVYDGRLVVDAQFRTTDKSIYAGGRHTEVLERAPPRDAARRRRPTALYHERYNSLELGAHLARCVLDRLDPRVDPVEAPPTRCPIREAADRGIVDDWIAFFRSDWCSALKHDRFADLQRTLADMIDRDEGARDVVSMLLAGLDAGKDDETLRQLRAKAVGVGGSNLPKETRQLLETAVLGYLRKNRTLLPRFLLPEKPHGKASVVAPP